MPPIKSLLEKYDLDLLLRIARAWDVEISQRDAPSARADLVAQMVNKEVFRSVLGGLDEPARLAWQTLAGRGGRQTWAEFSRLNGEIRDLGAAARQREQPDLHPVSISETLWYSGVIGRAFLGGASEPVEYAFIPDELASFIQQPAVQLVKASVRPAVNQSPRHVARADSAILDQLTDLLAANRAQRELPEAVFTAWAKPQRFLQALLMDAGLTAADRQPKVEALREFFNSDRDKTLQRLFLAWRNSTTLNELRMLTGLTCEGNWRNDPMLPRQVLIESINKLETGTWWSISSLLSTVKEVNPDFQRPAGDYDSWFIRDDKTGAYLTGFSSWDRVEGALLYYLLTGPMHWLGVVNLARGSIEGKFTAFQLVPGTRVLLNGETPATGVTENRKLQVKGARTLVLKIGTPRLLRYQVGRSAELSDATSVESRYQLTPDSLKKAAEQGLQIQQLIQLLDKDQPGVVTEDLKRLVERWTKHGKEAGFERALLLRFKNAESCAEFLRVAGSRFNLEKLNPQTLAIAPAQQESIRRLLAELGILADDEADV
jgi:hypothetical protein